MIPDRWYPILEASKLRKQSIGLKRLGRQLVLWRADDGGPVAADRGCPHRGASLVGGRVEGGELACPWHGFRFDSAGSCTQIPCEGRDARIPKAMRLRTHPVRESHGLLWLWYGAERSSYPELPLLDEMQEDTRNAYEASYTLPYHYSRMVETNLDLHHTPFVHGSVFKHHTRFDDFEAEREGDYIRTRCVARREDGKGRDFPVRADTLLPCLGMVELTPKLQILISATPVDEENTWLWFRYQQRYTTLPGLRKWIAWISVKSELVWVQPQDWRIFETMTPGTLDDSPHCYVTADKGIGLYRRRRAELLDAALQAKAS